MCEYDRVRRMEHGGSDGGSDRRMKVSMNDEMKVR